MIAWAILKKMKYLPFKLLNTAHIEQPSKQPSVKRLIVTIRIFAGPWTRNQNFREISESGC